MVGIMNFETNLGERSTVIPLI